MKNKKAARLITAGLVTTMTVGMLAGCGGEDKGSKGATSESGETVITFGIHVANPAEQEPVTNSIVEAFNEKYAGQYKVEFEAADTEAHSKNMKLEASDGTLP